MLAPLLLLPFSAPAPSPVAVPPPTTVLQASDFAEDVYFGLSVAASLVDSGAAYVYRDTGGGFVEEAVLLPDDASAGDFFGYSVALDGDTAVVAARNSSVLANLAGAAYVFVREPSGWVQQARLLASDGEAADYFGQSVAIEGDRVMVGSVRANDPPFSSVGCVYEYVRSGTSWSEVGCLRPTTSESFVFFGNSVDLSGDSVAIGASGLGTGRAYVYVHDGSSWTQEVELVTPSPGNGDQFGVSVSIDGDFLVVGSPHTGTQNHGVVRLYRRETLGWVSVFGRTGTGSMSLGRSVAVEGNRFAAGAPGESGLFVFELVEGGWAETFEQHPDFATFLGTSMAFEDGLLVSGAPYDALPAEDAGRVLVLALDVFGDRFCNDYDGSLSACPCANPGNPDSGCDNAQSTGGVLLEATAFDPDGLGGGTAVFTGTGYNPSAFPSYVLLRSTAQTAAVPAFDGVLCLAAPVVRVGSGFAAAGTATES